MTGKAKGSSANGWKREILAAQLAIAQPGLKSSEVRALVAEVPDTRLYAAKECNCPGHSFVHVTGYGLCKKKYSPEKASGGGFVAYWKRAAEQDERIEALQAGLLALSERLASLERELGVKRDRYTVSEGRGIPNGSG